MPGETASCIGCHDQQNSGPPVKYTIASQRKPVTITPWNGPVRGISFDREVQPVLDRRCAGCHNGQPYQDGPRSVTIIDLRAKQFHPEFAGDYSPAYMELQRYVRRAGYEADMHLLTPAEFEADTSPLMQILKKGHYNVELTRDEWERLYTWIDYNVPYPSKLAGEPPARPATSKWSCAASTRALRRARRPQRRSAAAAAGGPLRAPAAGIGPARGDEARPLAAQQPTGPVAAATGRAR